MIISELLNINTALTKFNKIVCVTQIITIIVYFLTIVFLREIIDVSIIDMTFVKNVAIIVLVSWLPLHIVKLLRVKFDPTENEKIMRDMN